MVNVMSDFFNAVVDTNTPFVLYALIAGILSSVSFGMVGTLVVTRRITYLAGAISHCVLGGIGLGLYLQNKVGLSFFSPMLGAFLAAISAAIIIGLISIYSKEREDTVIGALWAFGMAVGLIFIAKTPGYVDPMSYLFGNILLVSKENLFMIIGLDLLVVLCGIGFYHKFMAICFDEEFARLRGVQTNFYYILLLCLTAVTIVTLVYIVGIVMVIALLTLPAAMASQFTKHLWQTMILATVFAMIFNISGISLSYIYNLPSGATIIIISVVVYLISTIYNLRSTKR